VAPAFVRYALDEERNRPAGIRYAAASAQRLPFRDAVFDFATAFMSLIDMPEPHAALREACRDLRPGGFLQFSITHPCFDPPYRKLLRDGEGDAYAVEVGRYFEDPHGRIGHWLFSEARPPPEPACANLKCLGSTVRCRIGSTQWWMRGFRSSGWRSRAWIVKRRSGFRRWPIPAWSRIFCTCVAGSLCNTSLIVIQ
jgi:SAM-dependent methyltransferase